MTNTLKPNYVRYAEEVAQTILGHDEASNPTARTWRGEARMAWRN